MIERPRELTDDEMCRMTPAERVAHSFALTAYARRIALERISRAFPEENERCWRLRLAAEMYGAELIKKAFDWPPG